MVRPLLDVGTWNLYDQVKAMVTEDDADMFRSIEVHVRGLSDHIKRGLTNPLMAFDSAGYRILSAEQLDYLITKLWSVMPGVFVTFHDGDLRWSELRANYMVTLTGDYDPQSDITFRNLLDPNFDAEAWGVGVVNSEYRFVLCLSSNMTSNIDMYHTMQLIVPSMVRPYTLFRIG